MVNSKQKKIYIRFTEGRVYIFFLLFFLGAEKTAGGECESVSCGTGHGTNSQLTILTDFSFPDST